MLTLLNYVPAVSTIIIDGHAQLDGVHKGLGQHLHECTGLPVIGVAKNQFKNGVAKPVLRGSSKTPLWVSTAGYDEAEAIIRIQNMAGPYRIPQHLKHVDALSRGRQSATKRVWRNR